MTQWTSRGWPTTREYKSTHVTLVTRVVEGTTGPVATQAFDTEPTAEPTLRYARTGLRPGSGVGSRSVRLGTPLRSTTSH